jgi:hypothetical protein
MRFLAGFDRQQALPDIIILHVQYLWIFRPQRAATRAAAS